MRKTKIAAIVAAAAVLVLGMAFTSMAATYNWKLEEGGWTCYDENDNQYIDEWAKDGTEWYYLNEDGFLATELLLDARTSSSQKVYLGTNGTVVKSQWVKIFDEEAADGDGDYFWYYFGSNGYAYKSGKKTVGDNDFCFNAEGHMLTGWVNGTKDDNATSYADALYYCGGDDDGVVRKATWEKIDITDDEKDADINEAWFYFATTGKKYSGKTYVINGKTYAFDDDGVMVSGWNMATDSEASISELRRYRSAEDGAQYESGWFQAYAPSDEDEEGDLNWYYAEKKGKLAISTVKKIGSKYYCFNEKGIMQSGLVEITGEGTTFKVKAIIDDNTTGDSLVADLKADKYTNVYYFSGDADADGSMKTGSQKIDVNGDEVTLEFKAKGTYATGLGKAVNQVDATAIIKNGYKLTADADLKYGFVKVSSIKDETTKKPTFVLDGYTVYAANDLKGKIGTDKYICINTAGKAQKTITNKTDGDGWYINVKSYKLDDITADKK